MMTRFCRYIDRLFHFSDLLATLTDTRHKKQISTVSVFASAFAMFASGRTSLNSLEKDLLKIPRLRGVVGARPFSVDTLARVYTQINTASLRQMICSIQYRLKRNKALADVDDLKIVAIDGHEFFASRKRCCPQCRKRIVHVADKEVNEYYHQGVICHLIEHQLALPMDIELMQPGEGETAAARRLLKRVVCNYPRYFDVVCGDALYFDASFINFCLDHHKDAIMVLKGNQQRLLQDAMGVFTLQEPQVWQDGKRTVQIWDAEDFETDAVRKPLRVVHTIETVHSHKRSAKKQESEPRTSKWFWATTLPRRLLSTQRVWYAGHHRWDVENDCFNTLATHWGMNHCFKHDTTAIINFVLTLFIAYALLQCFWKRNVKPAFRKRIGTLINLADELRRSSEKLKRAPWYDQLARPP